MVSVEDILYKIARDFRGYNEADTEAAIKEFFEGVNFDMHLAITTDLEETCDYFFRKYGSGHTSYFKLRSYEHGKGLAAQLYYIFYNHEPDMSSYTGNDFKPEDKLYLSVHVRNPDVRSTAGFSTRLAMSADAGLPVNRQN